MSDRVLPLKAKWVAEADRYRRDDARVAAAKLIERFLSDVDALLAADAEDLLTLTEASTRSGYSRGPLGRLVRQGILPNAGRRNAPRIRASDLPVKATGLPADDSAPQFTHTSRRQVVRAIVGDREELTR